MLSVERTSYALHASRVVVERRDGTRWKPVRRGSVRAKNKDFYVRIPRDAAAAVTFRLRGTVHKSRTPQYRVGQKWRAKIRIPVTKPYLRIATPPLGTEFAEVKVWGAPGGLGRQLEVQRWSANLKSWQLANFVVIDRRSGNGSVRLGTAATPERFRVYAPAWDGLPALYSPEVPSGYGRIPRTIVDDGGPWPLPDHTIAALDGALKEKATDIAATVFPTADGTLVLRADNQLGLSTNYGDLDLDVPPRLSEMTDAQVAVLDAGSWRGPAWSGQRIPTLDAWLTRLAGRARVHLRMGSTGPGATAALTAALAEGPLARLRAAGKLVVITQDQTWGQQFASEYPEVPLGYNGPLVDADDAQWARHLYLTYTHPPIGLASTLRGQGRTVVMSHVFAHDLEYLVPQGADAFMTKTPAAAAGFFGGYGSPTWVTEVGWSSGTGLVVGHDLTVTAKVLPVLPGQVVRLQHTDGRSRTRPVAAGVTDASGTVRLRTRVLAGSYQLVCKSPYQDAPCRSSTKVVAQP